MELVNPTNFIYYKAHILYMALVPQIKRTKVRLVLNEIENRIRFATDALEEEQDFDNKLDAAYIASRDPEAKAKMAEIVKLIRWLIDDLSLPTPTAYTDAEIDDINDKIRQYDDGL